MLTDRAQGALKEPSISVEELASPVVKMQADAVTTRTESPLKFSAAKNQLALRHESVEKKEVDSILGESPSPSKVVERRNFMLNSPQ